MIRLLTHITTATEIARLPYIRRALQRCIPNSQLSVLNQSGFELAEANSCENIKCAGFGWTLRFLELGLARMKSDDLLIKIDPDIDIKGNPLDGIFIPPGACFGQIKLVKEVPVVLGGFQGFTYGAITTLLEQGRQSASEPGPQDAVLYRLGASLGMAFISLPWVDLWAERNNYDPNSKVISWRRAQ